MTFFGAFLGTFFGAALARFAGDVWQQRKTALAMREAEKRVAGAIKQMQQELVYAGTPPTQN